VAWHLLVPTNKKASHKNRFSIYTNKFRTDQPIDDGGNRICEA